MDWDNLIPFAALVVAIVGPSAAAVWKIVTRTEYELRDEIREAQRENETAHAGIVTRLEDGFKEVNRGSGISTAISTRSSWKLERSRADRKRSAGRTARDTARERRINAAAKRTTACWSTASPAPLRPCVPRKTAAPTRPRASFRCRRGRSRGGWRRSASGPVSGGLSGHSGRVGMAVELVRGGASTTTVQEAGGWKTADVVARYAPCPAGSDGRSKRGLSSPPPRRRLSGVAARPARPRPRAAATRGGAGSSLEGVAARGDTTALPCYPDGNRNYGTGKGRNDAD